MGDSNEARPRRARRAPATQEHVARLAAVRDRLDAEQAARRQREDELFAEFAAAAVDHETAVAGRDRLLDDLNRQRAEITTRTEAALQGIERRQTAVLEELRQLGRPVEQLAELVDLPVKVLRQRLRDHRAALAGPATSTKPVSADDGAPHQGDDLPGDAPAPQPDGGALPSATPAAAEAPAEAPAAAG
jgi:DNA-directed RNA polymerase specialized sigma24 family protein